MIPDARACASAPLNTDAWRDPSPAAGSRPLLPQVPAGRLMNAVSMTLLVVLRVYMVAVAGVVAFRIIAF
jgi:hypothetical protein